MVTTRSLCYTLFFGVCLVAPWVARFIVLPSAPSSLLRGTAASSNGGVGLDALRTQVRTTELRLNALQAERVALERAQFATPRSIDGTAVAAAAVGPAATPRCERLDLASPTRAAELVALARRAHVEWLDCRAPPSLLQPMHDQLGANLAKAKKKRKVLFCPVLICLIADPNPSQADLALQTTDPWRLYKLVPFSFPPYNFAGVVNPIWHTTRVGATTWLVFDQGRRMSMLAPYIFPQRATLLEHLPDNGLWKSLEGGAPDVILATGYNLHPKEIKEQNWKRSMKSGKVHDDDGEVKANYRAVDVSGDGTDFRYIDVNNRVDLATRRGKWVDGVYWPYDIQPHTYQRGKWPFIIAANTEPWGCGSCREFSVIMDTKKEQPASLPNCVAEPGAARTKDEVMDHSYGGCNAIHAPLFAMSFGDRSKHSVINLLRKKNVGGTKYKGLIKSFNVEQVWKSKSKFAAFMANNCGMIGNEQKLTHATTRIAFFDMLSEYKKVDGLGKCRHTAGSTPAGRRHSGNFWDSAVDSYEKYKFVLTFDNMHSHGLVTEKLANALLAESVPIYWGAPDLGDKAKYGINEKAIIRCDFPTISPKDAWRAKFAGFSEKNPDPADFETQIRFLRERMENDPGVKECIKRIKELDGNDAMYKATLSESFIGDSIAGSFVDPLRYGARLQGVMRSARSLSPKQGGGI